jgi:small subunit ribosomal protein S16
MALKIRLRQQGRNNRPFYRLVLTDVRSPRDGKYLEALGWYNPFESELDKSISLNEGRIVHWLNLGAELSERAASLVAKIAPTVIRTQTAKALVHRKKLLEKRKARKKAAAA